MKDNLPTIVPGDFTGVYTSKITKLPVAPIANSGQAMPTTFKNILDSVGNQIKVLKQSFQTQYQVQNVPNYLPFTALVSGEVGPYGLIFAGPALRLCQYHKKTSPPPRY